MTTLRERLADLADEAPAGSPADGLWDAGRRQQRLRNGSAGIVASALVLLVGLAGASWSQSRADVEPARPSTELGIPDRVYEPSPRLPGTDDTGPIGPLVAVLPGLDRGPVGISATGEYAVLDLPGQAGPDLYGAEAGPVISADGTRVAYWRRGTPSGAPGDRDVDPVGGVGVYDTVTGAVEDYDVPSKHGVGQETLVWAGEVLWFGVWQLDGPSSDGGVSSTFEKLVAWDLGSGRTVVQVGGEAAESSMSGASAWQDAVVTMGGKGRVRLLTPGGSEPRARLETAVTLRSPVFLSADGSRLVALRETDADNGGSEVEPVEVADLPADPEVPAAVREVPGTVDTSVNSLLGWRDETRVVGLRYGRPDAGVVSIDVGTGEMERLTRLDGNAPVLAADALVGPVFAAPAPPEPLDPRLVYGGGAAILLAAGAALVWWRRRAPR